VDERSSLLVTLGVDQAIGMEAVILVPDGDDESLVDDVL